MIGSLWNRLRADVWSYAFAPTTAILAVFCYYGFTRNSVRLDTLGMLVGIAVALSLLVIPLMRNTHVSLVVSLIGFRRTGKTVYLTVLFDYLRRIGIKGFVFRPYGAETLDEVTRDLDLLSRREWLPPTTDQSYFPYRAQVLLGRGLYRRTYKLEINDYPGEESEEVGSSGRQKWMHRSSFLTDAIQCDALILAIDTKFLLNADGGSLAAYDNELVAVIERIVQEKGVPISRRMRTPLSIVFMKDDLVPADPDESGRTETLNKLLAGKVPNVVSYCQKTCIAFKT